MTRDSQMKASLKSVSGVKEKINPVKVCLMKGISYDHKLHNRILQFFDNVIRIRV